MGAFDQAALSKGLIDWQRALEVWEMRESQVINGWKREGKVEGQVEVARAWVLEAIQVLLEDPVPEVIQLAVEGTNDLNTLRRWYRAALTAGSLADFRAAMSA